MGKTNALIQLHLESYKLGKTLEERQNAYKALFQIPLESKILKEISEVTNKGWTLGNAAFKKAVAQQLNRRVEHSEKGGDRKSINYLKNNEINPI